MTQTGIVPYIKEGYVQLPDGSRLSFLPTAPQLVSTTTIPVKVNINEGLSTGQARTLRQVIAGGAFATETTPFGRVKGFYHIVNTGNHSPVHLPLRRTSPLERDIVRQEVEKMLAHGVIRSSTSAWAAPIVLVKKKDNSTRFCVDYRELNNITVKDVFPLSRIDDMLAAPHGTRYFSSLDVASGYWQVGVDAATTNPASERSPARFRQKTSSNHFDNRGQPVTLPKTG
ncbi:putative Pol protein [Gregarina niphandrodes]|uniref:Pol protein n=1 Tax=Gregarina niphandrodes TaxID=110365 RepID=A0A023AX01_GRENI|nr:putative Pol protein [Gregarina niphandrodes]EZG42948.1 putative Pol protein [Gregarina niphandrodes]|eukprot:XP_011133776.1 putative Pol protein [Gregarina niphandrodes]